MPNKLPKFFDKHKICIICEGNEEYEYLKELKAKGYIVVAGKISTKFLAEKIYGMKVED